MAIKEPTTRTEIDCAKKGNEPALAAIIARQMPAIRLYARRAARPGLDFEDAVQEGLIGLFFAIEHFDEAKNATFATYASVCIRNAIASAQKAAGRRKHAPLNHSVPIPDGQSTPGPEEQAIANEQMAITLEKAHDRLSPLEKQVLFLTLDGYTHAQIAASLGKNPKAVENALSRLRRKLK